MSRKKMPTPTSKTNRDVSQGEAEKQSDKIERPKKMARLSVKTRGGNVTEVLWDKKNTNPKQKIINETSDFAQICTEPNNAGESKRMPASSACTQGDLSSRDGLSDSLNDIFRSV